ncbi:iron uptake system protein EfeO [Pseudomonas oryzihabitans]|uniref:Iron uptake system EfeUOB component EfeO/EfeM n=1 Tax=Pseudomonas oryzihabitans TaxID=47885 RepID=A0AAJ2BQU8_9PSED|nr:iron uptake system protein EfeO [Pseudomonas psychrotolerans]MDR6236770.1 iron uptake system EfeUOB component EfeO/EfeM [Pseudomonas psychrotolerans]MDR6353817.1 iron uptake system EfeUOB component EfeO/EfeM [Pseudomonas psychrotolerans]
MTATPNATPPKQTSPALRLAVVASAGLLIVAAAAFYYASRSANLRHAAAGADVVTVDILANRCEPNALEVPAGPARFRIVNRSDRAVEWEILDGVLVVEERENIAPGLSQVINATLAPGDYAITCGLLSNPRGTLKVLPTAASEAASKAMPTLTQFIGPLSEYRVYLNQQSRLLLQGITALQQALAAGDLQQARDAYAAARLPYQRLAATAQRFAELDNRLNARADYYEKREQDPAFGGFHRIEQGLFVADSTAGLEPVAARLQQDATALRDALLGQSLPPEQLSGNAARLLHNLASTRISGEEERYSQLVLPGFAANLEGTRKVIDLLRPLLSKGHQDLQQQLDSQAQAFADALGDQQRPYANLSASDRDRIAKAAQALADSLDQVAPALGLTVTKTSP